MSNSTIMHCTFGNTLFFLLGIYFIFGYYLKLERSRKLSRGRPSFSVLDFEKKYSRGTLITHSTFAPSHIAM